MYKISKFVNWAVQSDDSIIVTNLLYAANTIKFAGSQISQIQQVLESNDFLCLDNDIKLKLIEHRFAIKEDIDENEILLFNYNEAVFSNKELYLVIFPTTACNFRCKYCFQDHQAGFMSIDVRDRIILFLKKNLRYFKSLFIGWFGGEPLLDANFLVDFIKSIKLIAANNRVPFTSNINTNGYNLSPEVFNELIKLNLLYYHITVDGPPVVHNVLRPHATAQDSFERIYGNLCEIKKIKNRHFRIVIRVNVSEQLGNHITEFMELMSEFKNDKRFHFIWHEIRDWGGMDKQALALVTKENIELMARVIEIANSTGLNSYRREPVYKDVLCQACKNNAYIINFDGTIEKCTLCTENVMEKNDYIQNMNHIGYMNEVGDMILEKEKIAKWVIRPELMEKCKNCSILPVCLESICPLRMKFSRNIYNSNCSINKKRFITSLSEVENAKVIDLETGN